MFLARRPKTRVFWLHSNPNATLHYRLCIPLQSLPRAGRVPGGQSSDGEFARTGLGAFCASGCSSSTSSTGLNAQSGLGRDALGACAHSCQSHDWVRFGPSI